MDACLRYCKWKYHKARWDFLASILAYCEFKNSVNNINKITGSNVSIEVSFGTIESIANQWELWESSVGLNNESESIDKYNLFKDMVNKAWEKHYPYN